VASSKLDAMTVRAALTPGTVSPTLPVPDSIERPEYAWKPSANEGHEPWVQTPETIEKMRLASKIAANALAEAGKAVAPGVTTDRLDRIAHEYMIDHGAYPSTLGYRGFPKSCCTSLNEVICHGIPDSTVIEDGDIVNIDVTAYIDGVHGDTNATFLAGNVSQEAADLVERTRIATERAIKAVKPGRELNVIGRVIEAYANRFGYSVVRDFTGHGIGETFHNGLVILHYDQPNVDTVIEPGMVFTIEPMINLGGLGYEIWDDDWTVVTSDRKWTAQFEHTLVVTESGAELLTLHPDGQWSGSGGDPASD
jgi:methionyl aminopeptidase